MYNRIVVKLLLVASMTGVGCQLQIPHYGHSVQPSQSAGGQFAIYLLADETLNGQQATEHPLESLELEAQPLITDGDVQGYDICSHRLTLTPEGTVRIREFLEDNSHQIGVFGRPFVVVVGDTPIYLGAFWSMVSSIAFDNPTIMVEQLSAEDYRIAHIEPGYPGSALTDRRDDDRIRQVLLSLGKLDDTCSGAVACGDDTCWGEEICCQGSTEIGCFDPNEQQAPGCSMMLGCDGPEDCDPTERCVLWGSGILRSECWPRSEPVSESQLPPSNVVCRGSWDCPTDMTCRHVADDAPFNLCELP